MLIIVTDVPNEIKLKTKIHGSS